MTREPSSRQLALEAGRWLAQLSAEDVTPDDYAECDTWRARSPRHDGAFQQSLSRLRAAERFGRPLRALLDERARHRRAVAGAALAATVLIAAFLGPTVLKQRVYETAIGEARLIALSDGSHAHLNTSTRLALGYGGDQRLVRLEYGEAHFDVAHDPDRPFVVETTQYRISSQQARFAMRCDGNALSITVSEGSVTFALAESGDASRGHVLRVAAGERLSLMPGTFTVTPLSDAEILRSTSWRHGLLIFEEQRLADVATEVSRYTGLRFVIDEDAGALPVVASIRTDDADGAVQALRSTLSEGFEEVTIERRGDVVHIRRRDRTR